jgi:K(+)-stimulated pyrophosphate-energized sodium pump
MESIPPDPRGERTSIPSVSASGDWPAQATDFVVNTVDSVRDRTTGTILTIARVTVFGLLAVELAIVLNPTLRIGLAVLFFLAMLFFVYRSFYGMRIPVDENDADVVQHQMKEG